MLTLRLNPNLPRVSSAVIACLTSLACAAIVVRYQDAVARTDIASNLAYAAIQADLHASSDASKLQHIKLEALAALHRYTDDSTVPEAAATLLENLQRLAKTYDVSIAGFDTVTTAIQARDVTPDALKGEDVVLRLRGAFRSVLLFERRLSSAGTLLRVDAIDFEAAGRHPVVVASTIHARLFYISSGKDAIR